MLVEVTHAAYSDETHYNTGRFRGYGVVTTDVENAAQASAEVKAILTAANVSEMKWEKLRTGRDRNAALNVIEWLFSKLSFLRIDILTWDTEDSRHKVARPDEIANLHRMFHHLMNRTLRRYPAGCTWMLFPDEQDSIEWERVHDFLDSAGTRSRFVHNLGGLTYRLRFERDFRIVQIVPSKSHTEPLIQVADLLAGMAAFSRTHIDTYRIWREQESGQQKLFEQEKRQFSSGEREKCTVLSEFRDRCRRCFLPVSLNSSQGLKTHNQSCALNFWHYEPQRESDKAQSRMPRTD